METLVSQSQGMNKKRLLLEQQVASIEERLKKWDDVSGIKEFQKLCATVVETHETALNGLCQRLDSMEEKLLGTNWMRGLTKSLVAIQLAESKTLHYEAFVKPSWNRLKFDPHTSKVLADLFIACHPNICGVIDEKCIDIGHNVTRDTFMSRQENELLCLYAAVPEKENEKYRFAHSLNFLEMEPFTSILNMDYYDYIMRSDADAMLLPGLLKVPPTGDGWIGSGFYGTELTNHLVQRYTSRFLPELGPPIRPNETTPSMQSTFYIHKSKFRKFASVLLNATKTLYEKAFTKDVCGEIDQLSIAKELHPEEKGRFCRWAYWHQGVSSLYGTRIAVDHVLKNVTVTKSLDALAGSLDRQEVSTTIQAHLIQLKHLVSITLDQGATGICSHPIETLRKFGETRGDANMLFDDMEEVYRDHEKAETDIIHYTADILFQHFHTAACLEEGAES